MNFMKIKKTIVLFFIFFTLSSCEENKPFKPALEKVIIEAKNSLKNEISQNKILSIEFNSDKHFRKADFKIFITNSYSSIYVDGFVKYKGLTIAIYNLTDDYCELINKNDITFFTDTIIGFEDKIGYPKSQKQFLYSIIKDGIIIKVPEFDNFPGYPAVRMPKYRKGISYSEPIDSYFQYDSIKAEREVEYYRNIGKKVKGHYPPQRSVQQDPPSFK